MHYIYFEWKMCQIVKDLSIGTGQGFKKCTCMGKCTSKIWKCFKENLICNSACHPKNSFWNNIYSE